jgi:hypothetical protein
VWQLRIPAEAPVEAKMARVMTVTRRVAVLARKAIRDQ